MIFDCGMNWSWEEFKNTFTSAAHTVSDYLPVQDQTTEDDEYEIVVSNPEVQELRNTAFELQSNNHFGHAGVYHLLSVQKAKDVGIDEERIITMQEIAASCFFRFLQQIGNNEQVIEEINGAGVSLELAYSRYYQIQIDLLENPLVQSNTNRLTSDLSSLIYASQLMIDRNKGFNTEAIANISGYMSKLNREEHVGLFESYSRLQTLMRNAPQQNDQLEIIYSPQQHNPLRLT